MQKIHRQIALASIAFLISQLVLMIVVQFSNLSYFNSEIWSRWDSGHYMSIAQRGYEFFSCAGKFGYPADSPKMCGNTGWFPGYPLLLRLFSFLTDNMVLLGGIISKICYFLCLLMILVIHKIESITFKNIVYLLIPTFSFGFIYYNAIFPISTTLFFSLVALYLFLREKYWSAGICCLVVSTLYPTGFLLAFALAFTVFFREIRDRKIRNIIHAIPILLGGGLGVVLTFLVFHIQVDDWSAFTQVQSKYEHGIHNPIESIMNLTKKISFNSFTLKDMITWQSLSVIVGYVILSFFFFIKKLYRRDLFSYLFTTIFLVFPWVVGGNLSMYRAESLLLPFAFILKDMKVSWMLVLLVIQLSIGVVMSHLFFTSVLI